jgi:hypothetical protein
LRFSEGLPVNGQRPILIDKQLAVYVKRRLVAGLLSVTRDRKKRSKKVKKRNNLRFVFFFFVDFSTFFLFFSRGRVALFIFIFSFFMGIFAWVLIMIGSGWDDAEEEVEAFLESSVKGDLEEFDDEMEQMRQK